MTDTRVATQAVEVLITSSGDPRVSSQAVETLIPAQPTDPYGALVFSDTPVAYWRFSEGAGTTVIDSMGNGRTLTLSTGSLSTTYPSLPLGTEGYSFDVVAAAPYASVPDAAWHEPANFTVECWFNADATSSYRALVTRDGSGTRGWNFYLLSGQLHWYDNGASVATGTTTVTTGRAYHAAAVYNGTNITLYLNGIQEAQANTTPGTTPTLGMLVGASYAGTGTPTFYFDGRIDEVAFYNTALSQTTLKNHYLAGAQLHSKEPVIRRQAVNKRSRW